MDSSDFEIQRMRKEDEQQVISVFKHLTDYVHRSIFKTFLFSIKTIFICIGFAAFLWIIIDFAVHQLKDVDGVSVQHHITLSFIGGLLFTAALYHYEAWSCIYSYVTNVAYEMQPGCFDYYSQFGRALLVAVVKDEIVGNVIKEKVVSVSNGTEEKVVSVGNDTKEKVVGIVAMEKTEDPNACLIQRMSILPEYRRKGIAKGLVTSLEQVARQCGYQNVLVETTEFQKPAVFLYRKLGYTDQPHSYGPPFLTAYFTLFNFKKSL